MPNSACRLSPARMPSVRMRRLRRSRPGRLHEYPQASSVTASWKAIMKSSDSANPPSTYSWPSTSRRTSRPVVWRSPLDIISPLRELLSGLACCSVTELDHIAVGHDILLAFHANLAGGLRRGHRPGGDQVIVRDDLGLDEALFEVSVDHTGGLGGGIALMNAPPPPPFWA